MTNSFILFARGFFLPHLMICLILCTDAYGRQRYVPTSQEAITLSYAPLVKRAAPAVVNIYAKRKTISTRNADPLMQFFFGDRLHPDDTGRYERSLGSGVIVDKSGILITCHHVIDNSENIKVVLQDKREFSANVMYSDPKTDLAVLKIENDASPMPYVDIMNSDDLEVGDLVLAIGNPFGVGQTVTSGIVSALARTAVGVTDYSFFIQTDASINPGNSGGALVNMKGELAGINTAIYSRSGGSNGIGFAIPANMVKAVTQSISEFGKIVRPWLGVSTQDVDKKIADALGLRRPQGALVKSVFPEGPAARAGIAPGDVIIGIGTHTIENQASLRFRIATFAPKSRHILTVFRDGQLIKFSVHLTPPIERPHRDRRTLSGGFSPFGGAVVVNLSPAVAEDFSLDYGLTGVLIEQAASGTPAANAGLKAGDVLLSLNGKHIPDVASLDRFLRTTRTRTWSVIMLRDQKKIQLKWLI